MEQWNNVELTILRKKSYSSDSNSPNKSELLQPGSNIKPKVTDENVESLVRRLYGITINEIKELISYDDRNYLIQPDW